MMEGFSSAGFLGCGDFTVGKNRGERETVGKTCRFDVKRPVESPQIELPGNKRNNGVHFAGGRDMMHKNRSADNRSGSGATHGHDDSCRDPVPDCGIGDRENFSIETGRDKILDQTPWTFDTEISPFDDFEKADLHIVPVTCPLAGNPVGNCYGLYRYISDFHSPSLRESSGVFQMGSTEIKATLLVEESFRSPTPGRYKHEKIPVRTSRGKGKRRFGSYPFRFFDQLTDWPVALFDIR